MAAVRARSSKKKPDAEPSDPPPFEVSLERLEAIVDELESGELDLAASLARFEEGVTLSRQCAEQLADARRRIDVLVEDNGGAVEQVFEADDAELD